MTTEQVAEYRYRLRKVFTEHILHCRHTDDSQYMEKFSVMYKESYIDSVKQYMANSISDMFLKKLEFTTGQENGFDVVKTDLLVMNMTEFNALLDNLARTITEGNL
jgi:hypothetical protein